MAHPSKPHRVIYYNKHHHHHHHRSQRLKKGGREEPRTGSDFCAHWKRRTSRLCVATLRRFQCAQKRFFFLRGHKRRTSLLAGAETRKRVASEETIDQSSPTWPPYSDTSVQTTDPATMESRMKCQCLCPPSTCDCRPAKGNLWRCQSHCRMLVCMSCIAIEDPIICHCC